MRHATRSEVGVGLLLEARGPHAKCHHFLKDTDARARSLGLVGLQELLPDSGDVGDLDAREDGLKLGVVKSRPDVANELGAATGIVRLDLVVGIAPRFFLLPSEDAVGVEVEGLVLDRELPLLHSVGREHDG